MQTQSKRRSAMLVLGFLGAVMAGACGSPIDPGASTSCPAPVDPSTDMTTECAEPTTDACWRYRLPLVGDPTSNVAVRTSYIGQFGSACYMSVAKTFDCFYKTWEEACAQAVKIGEVSGNAPYDTKYKCQAVGNGNYTLQVGSNEANKIPIDYVIAPLQSSLIEVKTVPTEVKGPYRDLVEVTSIKPEKNFFCSSGQVDDKGNALNQREWILEVNRKAHGGKIHSDLAGFTWPCVDENCKPTMCTEKLVLEEPSDPPVYGQDEAQVHHVVPKKDLRGCSWGTNAYKNAAVISARLNQYLHNKVPPEKEVLILNKTQAYTP